MLRRIGEGKKEVSYEPDLFDNAFREISDVLNFDIIPRFIHSPAFIEKVINTNLYDQLVMQSAHIHIENNSGARSIKNTSN